MFFCEYYKILRTAFFHRTPVVVASGNIHIILTSETSLSKSGTSKQPMAVLEKAEVF